MPRAPIVVLWAIAWTVLAVCLFVTPGSDPIAVSGTAGLVAAITGVALYRSWEHRDR